MIFTRALSYKTDQTKVINMKVKTLTLALASIMALTATSSFATNNADFNSPYMNAKDTAITLK